jgi:hypothetical protein
MELAFKALAVMTFFAIGYLALEPFFGTGTTELEQEEHGTES